MVFHYLNHRQAHRHTWLKPADQSDLKPVDNRLVNVTNTMTEKLMILPSKDAGKIRLLKIPEDYESHEVYRAATGAIARVEENVPDYSWDDLMEELEDMGFEEVSYILGPEVE
jgi:hypothetical protein